ncbi:aldolase/citrate lyase family protein [Thalassotalea ponticola]|uniref:HpcH/HpaI aldolase/citrate lyase family protein n=1 Tax=Thalassotalea ponticola TaxID=1523392 RepID=UPI0025B621D9|nr:aldolase/citrate lyase family protein [Thalassotalea ponticola]MDN3651239.1 aldolase/citrate lyase family protein [Thalassotalea ponticola]
MNYHNEFLDQVNEQDVLGGFWPGIQLYYPPIKYSPKDGSYETLEQASERMRKHAHLCQAHTLLFDLEDGCRQKEQSRQLLINELPQFAQRSFQIAVRINPFRTEEYEKDLQMIRQVADYVDVIVLAKAGESYGAAEIRDLSAWLVAVNPNIEIQPIIEHPRSLKIADQLMAFSSVKHVVFGIHDFSKAMAIHLTPEGWIDELLTYLRTLLLEARIAGKGVIGGVEVLINDTPMPEKMIEPDDVRRWLDLHGDHESHVVHGHALIEAQMGLTGKQLIHPYHIHLCKVAFTPSPKEIKRNVEILQAAIAADALLGGAIKFEGEMLDPPMFGKALQSLLRAYALKSLNETDKQFALSVLKMLPVSVIRENWPYGRI